MNKAIIDVLLIIPGFLVGFSLHEYAHAKAADMLGDDTARKLGRLTIDPRAHIDILGFIMLLVARFGWGKPVPVNENNFKNPSREGMIVSLAGPMANLIVAISFIFILKMIYTFQLVFFASSLGQIILSMIWNTIWINLVLMTFNLIPIPPLDGYHILSGLLNFRKKGIHYQFYDKGPILLLIFVITGASKYVLIPPVQWVFNFLVRTIL